MMPAPTRRSSGREWGYSLLELMFVVGLTGTMAAIAVVQTATTRAALKGDAAMRTVLAQLNQARQMSIGQRKYFRITFDTTNSMVVVAREDSTTATTTIATIPFEYGAKFQVIAGQPDTPDGFGNGAATTFTSTNGTFASTAGSTSVAKFAPNGTLVDWNGRTVNGSIFVAIPTLPMSARAITILGSTGRIRGYRWNGTSWTTV